MGLKRFAGVTAGEAIAGVAGAAGCHDCDSEVDIDVDVGICRMASMCATRSASAAHRMRAAGGSV
jgi:hypothetical protein